MSKSVVLALWFAVSTTLTVADSGIPDGARILDGDALLYHQPKPIVSPDGNWVAYVSKGHICTCNVKDPQPMRVGEVAGSWTDLLSRSEYAYAKGNPDAIRPDLTHKERMALLRHPYDRRISLQWTYDSKALVWDDAVLRDSDTRFDDWGTPRQEYESTYWISSPDGAATKLLQTRRGGGGRLTRDHKYLVTNGHPRALLWDVATDRPRATPYYYLTPSSTSDRWIGIEKDTRQLVILNKDFAVAKRFEEHQPKRSYGFELLWSPDERYILLRNQVGFDHYSNWEGFWLDLQSGDKRPLEGQFMSETFGFTGRDGEFFRCGAEGKRSKWISGSDVTGARFTLYPEPPAEPVDLWRLSADDDPRRIRLAQAAVGPTGVFADPTGARFVFTIDENKVEQRASRYRWNLLDRTGKLTRLPQQESKDWGPPRANA